MTLNGRSEPTEVDEQTTVEELRRHQFAVLALTMLGRLDVSPDDQDRVNAIAVMIRKLGNLGEQK
jgi:hypothetical protein